MTEDQASKIISLLEQILSVMVEVETGIENCLGQQKKMNKRLEDVADK